MRRRTRIIAILLVLAITGLLVASYTLVPHSVRLYMASTATCTELRDALAESPDPLFDGIKFWEIPLAKFYRAKYWYFGGPTIVNDWAVGESNVFTVFITASARTGGHCDREILELQRRYLDGSRSVDDYDEAGYTALHQAIIYHKPDFVEAYLDGGANRWLNVRSDNKSTNNKNAIELAETIAGFEFSPPVSDQIAEMLANAN